jgi:hypothetical protein
LSELELEVIVANYWAVDLFFCLSVTTLLGAREGKVILAIRECYITSAPLERTWRRIDGVDEN